VIVVVLRTWRIGAWARREAPSGGAAASRSERMTRPPTEAALWNKRTVSRVDPPMDGTGVSGSSSGQAVGFDPGGLSHFCRANPATVKFRGRQLIAVRHRRLRGAFRRFIMGVDWRQRAPARAPLPAIPGLSDGRSLLGGVGGERFLPAGSAARSATWNKCACSCGTSRNQPTYTRVRYAG
jgi:hypothetical protein